MNANDENEADQFVTIHVEGYILLLQFHKGRLHYNLEGSTNSRFVMSAVRLYLRIKGLFK